jgi:polyisoprenoid-binding protein YceI
MKTGALAIVTMMALPQVAVAGTKWNLDTEHTEVGFRVRHMMVAYTKGNFRKFHGTVEFDDRAPQDTKIDVTIDAASVDTNNAKRDEHLKSADFFDVAKFPTLRFVSTRATPTGAGGLKVDGQLTLRGVTKPVVLDVSELGEPTKDPWGGVRRGATAKAKLNRKDFGLMWNAALEAGGVAVGDEVQIVLEIELVQQAPAPKSAT